MLRKLKNTENIAELRFSVPAYPFCPLGDVHYKAQIECYVQVGEWYPDYVDLTAEFQKLNGENLTVERLALAARDIVKSFEPLAFRIEVSAESEKHCPVTVVIRD